MDGWSVGVGELDFLFIVLFVCVCGGGGGGCVEGRGGMKQKMAWWCIGSKG